MGDGKSDLVTANNEDDDVPVSLGDGRKDQKTGHSSVRLTNWFDVRILAAP
jgi:hypothetical protein